MSSRFFTAIAALERRGLLYGLTGQKEGQTSAARPSIDENAAVYAGFDPTANSLQVGNLVTIVGLLQFREMGFRTISVVGEATGLVGDPSGRTKERAQLERNVIERNADCIEKSISTIFDNHSAMTRHKQMHPPKILRNSSWYRNQNVISFITTVGSRFRLQQMLNRDSVQQRLSSGAGMSFTEFAYQIFQAYDFLHLYQSENCLVQIGGSDQWGNITAGCELIRRAVGKQAYGVTLPLLVTSSGEKFGKSAGNAVWLSAEKTSCFDFYQYFLRTSDQDVKRLLSFLTLLPHVEIEETMKKHSEEPEKRLAQRRLATEVTCLVHGHEAVCKAEEFTSVLFHSKVKDASHLKENLRYIKSVDVPRDKVKVGLTLSDAVLEVKAVESKREAKRLIRANGVYVNDVRLANPNELISERYVTQDGVTLLRTGKTNYFLINWI
ncbi:tyrosine--tRNA ligase, mitochondrial-like [Oscarella lobularis]|uniref:tyrosine--tRNA ligase, mitochondrial-like n=1 Tax=Oscarella lobularis TaxID=121494 RepID=UPI0033131F5B